MGEPQKCLESYQYPWLYFDWYLKLSFPWKFPLPSASDGEKSPEGQRVAGRLSGHRRICPQWVTAPPGEVTALLLWGNHGEIWGIAPGADKCLALLLGLPQSKHLLQGDPRRKRSEMAAQSATAKW